MIVSADREYVKSRGSKIRKGFFYLKSFSKQFAKVLYVHTMYISTSRTAVLLLARGQKYIYLLIDF